MINIFLCFILTEGATIQNMNGLVPRGNSQGERASISEALGEGLWLRLFKRDRKRNGGHDCKPKILYISDLSKHIKQFTFPWQIVEGNEAHLSFDDPLKRELMDFFKNPDLSIETQSDQLLEIRYTDKIRNAIFAKVFNEKDELEKGTIQFYRVPYLNMWTLINIKLRIEEFTMIPYNPIEKKDNCIVASRDTSLCDVLGEGYWIQLFEPNRIRTKRYAYIPKILHISNDSSKTITFFRLPWCIKENSIHETEDAALLGLFSFPEYREIYFGNLQDFEVCESTHGFVRASMKKSEVRFFRLHQSESCEILKEAREVLSDFLSKKWMRE